MESSARESYLVTEVMTATPQKLQLMLIDAAIRSAQRARRQWADGQDDEACEGIIHAQQIVGEMLGGLNADVAPELVKNVAAVYLFIFRSLMEANHEHNEEKLDDAVRVLQEERETWRRMCEKLGSTKESEDGSVHATFSSPETASAASPAVTTAPEMLDGSPGSGLSLEA